MTTAPDSNVRAVRQRAARSAHAAGRSALARLLLRLLQHVFQLDRKLLLLLVASPMSACIIPAGPEFQDPPGVPNSFPGLVAVFPPEGTKVVDPSPRFSVTVTDPDGGDLWIRWIAEYPPFTLMTFSPLPERIPPPANGTAVRMEQTFEPTCQQLNRLLSTHQIMAAISDSEFVVSDGADILATVDNRMPLTVVWTWQKTCSGGAQ